AVVRTLKTTSSASGKPTSALSSGFTSHRTHRTNGSYATHPGTILQLLQLLALHLPLDETHHLWRITVPCNSQPFKASVDLFQVDFSQFYCQGTHVVFQIAHPLRSGDRD